MKIRKRIEYLAKKYSGKKIIIFGVNDFLTKIFSNYDLSSLNIVAICDYSPDKKSFFGHDLISINGLNEFNFDAIFVISKDFYRAFDSIEQALQGSAKRSQIKIEPFIRKKVENQLLTNFIMKGLFILFNPVEWVKFILITISFLGSFYIINKSDRTKKYNMLYHILTTQMYGNQVLRTALSIGANFYGSGFSWVYGYTILKNNVCFNGMRITGRGMVTIGNYFHSGENCSIITQTHNYDNGLSIPYDATSVYKNVEIADFVWLGSNVTILPGTKINDGAIIQAGSVVHGEIPAWAIVGGQPAKVFQ